MTQQTGSIPSIGLTDGQFVAGDTFSLPAWIPVGGGRSIAIQDASTEDLGRAIEIMASRTSYGLGDLERVRELFDIMRASAADTLTWHVSVTWNPPEGSE